MMISQKFFRYNLVTAVIVVYFPIALFFSSSSHEHHQYYESSVHIVSFSWNAGARAAQWGGAVHGRV